MELGDGQVAGIPPRVTSDQFYSAIQRSDCDGIGGASWGRGGAATSMTWSVCGSGFRRCACCAWRGSSSDPGRGQGRQRVVPLPSRVKGSLQVVSFVIFWQHSSKRGAACLKDS